MGRTVPVVFQVFCDMVLRYQCSPTVLAKHRMQVTCVVGTLSVVLRHPSHGDIERVDPVVVAAILERDRHITFSLAHVRLVNIIDGNFLVVPDLSGRLYDDHVTQEVELLP